MMVRMDKGKEQEGGMARYGGTSTETYCNECRSVLLATEQDRHTSFTPKVFHGTMLRSIPGRAERQTSAVD